MPAPDRARDAYAYLFRDDNTLVDFGVRASYELGTEVPTQIIKSLYSNQAYHVETREPWHQYSVSGLLWENDVENKLATTVRERESVNGILDYYNESIFGEFLTASRSVDSPTDNLRRVDWASETSGEISYGIPVQRRALPAGVDVRLPVKKAANADSPGRPTIYLAVHELTSPATGVRLTWPGASNNLTVNGAGNWGSKLYSSSETIWGNLADSSGFEAQNIAAVTTGGGSAVISVWVIYPQGLHPPA